MTRDRVRDLLTRVADGTVSPDHALDDLSKEPFESLDFATIDHHRALRQGYPEVIYGEGKTPDQIVATHSTNGAVDMTRPLCPYPQVAVYKGEGSTNDAASFACKAPAKPATTTR